MKIDRIQIRAKVRGIFFPYKSQPLNNALSKNQLNIQVERGVGALVGAFNELFHNHMIFTCNWTWELWKRKLKISLIMLK